ncbi:MAG: aldo/keto reductase [Rivularia sp. (in: Bacteria)]|nr:aldo/keto reductase [Rivularia sp. MS3]
MKTLHLSSGRKIPVLGQGTWRMGEDSSQKDAEIAALRLGLDMGMTLIDTAEMYGEGGAEEVVGEAIKNRREEVYLVSKVYPHNASRKGAVAACERSLKRLKTDCIDLYLLHWRSSIPLSETLEAFESLKQAGKIRDYGVSNFDADDMQRAINLPHGKQIVTNQVLYNLARRGIEWDLLPWSRQHNIPIMAYSPIEQKGILKNPQLKSVASRHNATPAQIALAWLLQQQGIIAIPKASNPEHVKENSAALDIQLTLEDLTELDKAFPPPNRKMSLAIR